MQNNSALSEAKLKEQEAIDQSQSELIESIKVGVNNYNESSHPLYSEDFFFSPDQNDEGLGLLDAKTIVKTQDANEHLPAIIEPKLREYDEQEESEIWFRIPYTPIGRIMVCATKDMSINLPIYRKANGWCFYGD